MQAELNELFRLGTTWNGTDEQMTQLETNPERPVVESTTGIRSLQRPHSRLNMAVDMRVLWISTLGKWVCPDRRAAVQEHKG